MILVPFYNEILSFSNKLGIMIYPGNKWLHILVNLFQNTTYSPKTLKWVAVYSSVIPHQWIAQRQVGPVSVYCTGWGVVSCVCGMTFLCGSTLVKVSLLQAHRRKI